MESIGVNRSCFFIMELVKCHNYQEIKSLKKYYDIGLNLFCRQFPEPEKIISEALDAGVGCILTGTDSKENRKIDDFVRNHDAFGTAGIHPHNADRAKQEDFIKRFRRHPEICQKSVVHCFTGDKATLDKYLSMGFYIGITGWICDDRRAKELREAVSIIPLERILVETDAPYLTPKNVQGLDRTNVPQNILYMVRDLAKYRKVSEEELMEHARKNTERLFNLS